MVNQENAIKAILGFGAFVDVIEIPKVEETSIVMIPRALFETSKKEGRVDFDISPGNSDGIKTIKIPFHFNFHYANGFEDEQGRVVFDTVQIEEATVSDFHLIRFIIGYIAIDHVLHIRTCSECLNM